MAGSSSVTSQGIQRLVDSAKKLRECVVTMDDKEDKDAPVRWGNVMQYDDPVSEDVFSPYSVWEQYLSSLGKKEGIVY
jgi:hypothetical protein